MIPILAFLVYAFVFLCAVASPVEEDFTDTGVGCVEDCLEPATK